MANLLRNSVMAVCSRRLVCMVRVRLRALASMPMHVRPMAHAAIVLQTDDSDASVSVVI